MANHHYGNIGDVWKHMVLCEILYRTKPDIVLESHAGAARYALTPAPERNHGIYHFLNAAEVNSTLRNTVFFNLLQELPGRDGKPNVYPGSPYIELTLLSRHNTGFIFCDLDDTSLENINLAAGDLNVSPQRVTCRSADGITTMMSAIADVGKDKTTLLHIDPFRLLDCNNQGYSSVDLFIQAALAGIKTLLWYPILSQEEIPSEAVTVVSEHLVKNSYPDHLRFPTGEIRLKDCILYDSNNRPISGETLLPGCGIMYANISDDLVKRCSELGHELADTYRDMKNRVVFTETLVTASE
ncbi:MAG TPA: 23S rRNA (adenine(2030)-N(6))-methyltransferase RlmJ [Phycisphaeraceae bacterium]|nr:23S rRNA (adenine(2030)-N(6))-methyltransferase RlmJ [Phycisphaeraceae bacterium]